jgi:hypothetical protein
MSVAPHALFESIARVENSAEPPDAALAESLVSACQRAGFACSEVDLWRDVGWTFDANVGAARFEIYFSRYREPTTLLAVAPQGRQSGGDGHLLKLCSAVHDELARSAAIRNLRWMLGGPPERVAHVETPVLLALS